MQRSDHRHWSGEVVKTTTGSRGEISTDLSYYTITIQYHTSKMKLKRLVSFMAWKFRQSDMNLPDSDPSDFFSFLPGKKNIKKNVSICRHLQLFSDLWILRQWNPMEAFSPRCCVVTVDPRHPLAASQRAGQKWLYCWMARPQICATKQAKSLRTQSHRFLFDCLEKGWSIDWMGLLFRSRVLCVTFYCMLMLYDHCCSHQHSVLLKCETWENPPEIPTATKSLQTKLHFGTFRAWIHHL